jgi:hypothetical protein
MFPNAQVTHLTSSRSDHCPILLNLNYDGAVRRAPSIRRYETYWEREASLADEIHTSWTMHKKPSDLGEIANNLKGVMGSLHAWSGRTIGSVTKQIEKKRKDLERVSSRVDQNSRWQARKISAELDELLEKEEIRWRQRSRISWLRSGDRNTKFFHRKATWRQKKNKIEKLQTNNGDVTSDTSTMENLATDFFKDLYSVDTDVQPGIIADLLQKKINDQINEGLCAKFTDEEISFALFQIGPTKAPGPDGFPASFFQRNWGTFKEDVIRAVKKFFETGIVPLGVNDTSIVLIPKNKNPISLRDYRPIILCNVIYKVVSKCLVKRLRSLLQDMISPTQSAFILGRMITENAIIAFECIHALQNCSANA